MKSFFNYSSCPAGVKDLVITRAKGDWKCDTSGGNKKHAKYGNCGYVYSIFIIIIILSIYE